METENKVDNQEQEQVKVSPSFILGKKACGTKREAAATEGS